MRPQPPTAASTSAVYQHSSRGRPYPSQSRGSWRKTYSLRNTGPQSSGGRPSVPASSPHRPASQLRTDDVSPPGHSRGSEADRIKPATVRPANPQQREEQHSNTRTKGAAANKLNTEAENQGSSPAVTSAPNKAPGFQQKLDNRLIVQPEKKSGSFSAPPSLNINISSKVQTQNRPALNTKSRTDVKKTSTQLPAGRSTPAPSQSAPPQSVGTKVQEYFLKKSKFTWVKSQTAESKAPVSSASKPIASAEKPSPAAVSKRTPPRKPARKLSPVTVAPRTSKYKWVSSSGLQTRTPRRPSPKALVLPQRILKTKAASPQCVKLKKETAVSPSSSSAGSRYRWKAGGPSASASGAAAASQRASSFHWSAERNKGTKAACVVAQRSLLLSPSPRGFKLRSRMKIIRR